ncbi:hypothetical protein [Methylocystis iwaonis]|uniref:Mobilization protein n=1 Tax=Methylocystis iwaonis TaxID=2885079 RepID=A0ABM8EF98_9HYPH|nr:hypothetical protein [Methylocystis iwaonis]BDV36730.1 hypothetical protein SS37A_42600 [Methylocystis iwaonis]
MTETALEKAQRKFEQAKAALDAVKAHEAAAKRKKDTRRKIVLGGALLELAKTDNDVSELVTKLIAGLAREHDKKLFEKSVRKESSPEPEKVEPPVVQPVVTPAQTPAPQQLDPSSAMPGDVRPKFRPDTPEI